MNSLFISMRFETVHHFYRREINNKSSNLSEPA